MKKTKLQVFIEFTSMLHQIKATKKTAGKILKNNKKRAGMITAIISLTSLLIGSANATF